MPNLPVIGSIFLKGSMTTTQIDCKSKFKSNGKRFKKIYLEISNICNLQCSFCPVVERDKKIISLEQFKISLEKINPFTEEVCLYLMGEPLAHPHFLEILSIADQNFLQHQVSCQITTNALLIGRYRDELLQSPALRQINFSIQSYPDNFPDRDLAPYLDSILEFCQLAEARKPELYVNLRLWNLFDPKEQSPQNKFIFDYINARLLSDHEDLEKINFKVDVSHRKSKKIKGRIYYHFDSRFEWPSLKGEILQTHGFCYGLKNHIGVHANGDVVPCCLDKEAVIHLGNLVRDDLDTILESKRAQDLLHSFTHFKSAPLSEELCKRCSYISRFEAK